MHIEKSSQGDLLELTLRGRLDNDSSIYFREEIEACAREGWHRILVDLGGVTYLSSSGIAALIAAKQRLERLAGLFGVHNATPDVEHILSLTRVWEMLRCDPQKARSGPALSTTTIALSATTRFVHQAGLELAIYGLDESPPLICRVFGNSQSLFDARHSKPRRCNVSFGPRTFGLGIGALGHPSTGSQASLTQDKSTQAKSTQSDSLTGHHGEFLAVAGAVAQSPHKSHGLPDYLLAAADFVPAADVLYGVQCEGDLPVLIRFSPAEADAQIGLSRIITSGLEQTQSRLSGFVILADCAGLVGAQLRQSPATAAHEGSDRFALPGLRDWLSFSAEQIHRHNLALIVGIAASEPLEPSSPLAPLLRPIGPDGLLTGHFHAAVFPYRPLKKRILPLHSSVTDLFESGSIEDVLHLLHDDRPISGLGESELFGGACWMGPIEEVVAVEESE
jgi:anti-anti-sigma factor